MVTDGPEGRIQYHGDHDKSPRRSPIALVNRKVRSMLRVMFPEKTFQMREREGIIAIDRSPMPRCISEAPDVFGIEFNAEQCRSLGFDTAKVREGFAEIWGASADSILWTSYLCFFP